MGKATVRTYRLKSGKVRYLVRDDWKDDQGKRHQTTIETFSSKREADRFCRQWNDQQGKEEKERKRLLQDGATKAGASMNLESLIREAFEWRHKYSTVRSSGYAVPPANDHTTKYNISLCLKIYKPILQKRICTITAANIIQAWAGIGDKKYTTKRQYKRKMMVPFEYAIQMKYLDKMPIDPQALSMNTDDVKAIKEDKNKTKTILTASEVDRLAAAFLYDGRHAHFNRNYHLNTFFYSYIVLFAFWTGMRISELLGVRFCDIDYDGRQYTIHLTDQYDTKTKKRRPLKNSASRRDITLPYNLGEALKALAREAQNWPHFSREWFVFGFDRFIHPESFRYALTQAVKALHDDDDSFPDDVTPHTFRHSHASFLGAKGIPVAYTANRLGHAEGSQITLGRYTHFDPTTTTETEMKISANTVEHTMEQIAAHYKNKFY